GNVILALSADGGQLPQTQVRYLAGGTYTVRYAYKAPGGQQPGGAVRFDLFLLKLSDGVGPYATSTSSGPPGGSDPSGGGYQYSGGNSSPPSGDCPYYF